MFKAIAFALFSFSFLFPLTALALTIETLPDVQVSNDFVLGPGKAELFLSPGESEVRELTVTNRTGGPIMFTIEVEDFIGSRDPTQATILLGGERGPYSLRDYVTLEEERFVLEHGERARIPAAVVVPPDAEPGGRYGSILFSAQSSGPGPEGETAAQGGARIITRLGALFFVRVQGAVQENGFLKNFRTLGRSVFSSSPITFELLFENNGSVHLNPYGLVTITNLVGQTVGTIEVDPWFAMPDSLRFREIRWEKSFLLGRYKARAQINRGYEDIIDETETVFWVFPWRVLLNVFILLFLVVIIGRWMLSRFEIRRKL